MSNVLKLTGVSLYYELRGAGPVLLLIPGGNGDAVPFHRVANELARQYTVVTYDRRGFSHSPVDEPPDDGLRLEIDSDDAHHLLQRVTDEPAIVFGSSSGAIVALDLVARHPEQIQTLVAHEPPAVMLLADAAQYLEFADDVYQTYRDEGVEAAMQKFTAGIGLSAPARPQGGEVPPHLVDMLSTLRRNQEFWLEHELRQYVRRVPDIDALKAVTTRLVLAGGRDSREHFPYRPNTVLAERLGVDVVDFPGGHLGYMTHPVDFAARLTEVLGTALL
jgi:pimeloyl-ACP methyl ester carboxylesterase